MMGMPITVEIADASANPAAFEALFDYFHYIDQTFSTYKDTSEITRINRRELQLADASADMQAIFVLAEHTRQQTYGYFDIHHKGLIDPSGIVKGWAIYNAAALLADMGCANYYVDAGGDIQVSGQNSAGQAWRVGIRSPFNVNEIVKVVALTDCGIATSGTSIRGQHIYNPRSDAGSIDDVLSLTVIGPNIYEADRFATAAFAMGADGIRFIESLDGLEGYMIDAQGIATLTSGFGRYVLKGSRNGSSD